MNPENIVKMLEEKGFDKEAGYVSDLNRAMERTPRNPRMFPPEPKAYSVTDPNMPFAKKGEPVIQIDPVTGKESIVLWGIDPSGKPTVPKTKEDITKDIHMGVIDVVQLEKQYQKADFNAKKFLQPLVALAEEVAAKKSTVLTPAGGGRKWNLKSPIKKGLFSKLAFIQDSLNKRGYVLLAKKLDKAVVKYASTIEELVTDNRIPE